MKLFWPALPFIDRVGLVFLACIVIGVALSQLQGGSEHEDAIDYKAIDTSTSSGFNWASLIIILMLAGLYVSWW